MSQFTGLLQLTQSTRLVHEHTTSEGVSEDRFPPPPKAVLPRKERAWMSSWIPESQTQAQTVRGSRTHLGSYCPLTATHCHTCVCAVTPSAPVSGQVHPPPNPQLVPLHT